MFCQQWDQPLGPLVQKRTLHTKSLCLPIAMTVCRPVCWALHEVTPVNGAALQFMNRLSDLLFVAARRLARADGGKEVIWNHQRPGSG